MAYASPPTVLQWHHPRIILLSKGVFPAPHGVQEPWWYPELRDPCPAFAAMSLGISPLLTNEHLIKRKKKKTTTQEKEKNQIKIPTKGPVPREHHQEQRGCCQLGRIPCGLAGGG